jgi:(p)ppGpp synthase/HD superfamily hydrolase
MEFLRMDLFSGEIFVFVPARDVQALPTGATPIAIAYSMRTDVSPLACRSLPTDTRNSSRSPFTELLGRQKVSFDDRSD